MTNQDKNTRTLIVCFVILIMAMVPLRFIEVKNLMNDYQSQVLGEETEVLVEKVNKVNIILPNAEINLGDIGE